MTWPPSPPVFLASFAMLCVCLLSLWVIASMAINRWHQARVTRDARAAVAELSRAHLADWLDEAPFAWPGPEIDDAITARQVQVARALHEARS